jgi:hypothetical protein
MILLSFYNVKYPVLNRPGIFSACLLIGHYSLHAIADKQPGLYSFLNPF